MADEVTEKVNPFQAEVDKTNSERKGKGLRFRCGMTRGKGSLPIKWEEFDENQPETVPSSVKEFMELTGVKTDKDLTEYLIVGFNDGQYREASDPIREYINPAWDDDTKSQFRLVVRNFSKATGMSIEDAVSAVKPAVEKGFATKSKAD